MKKQNGKGSRDYFILPHPVFMFLVPFGLYLLTASLVDPTSIPGVLGPFAVIGRYMGQNYPVLCKIIACVTVLIHIYEGNIARRRCRQLNLSESATVKWTLSTFVFGYPSLSRLEALREKK